MNKKIYVGMMSLGVAATFWACGSGEIITPNQMEEGVLGFILEEEPTAGLNMISPDECPACYQGAVSSSSSKKAKSSSSSKQGNPGSQDESSSSKIEVNTSSSATPTSSPTPYSSSRGPNPGVSSSSSATPLPSGTVGTCAPQKATIELDDSRGVTWKFEQNKQVIPDATQLLSASFAWTFEGGTPATASAKGASGITQTVKYTTSGDHGASLTLSIGGSAYSVTCSPVHVNGSPITGCKCAPVGVVGSVNYLETPGVQWEAKGCSTGAGLKLTYAWDGGAAGAESSYTKTLTEASAAVAPTLTVYNDDNSAVNVECSPVKVTEGPEYTIKDNSETGKVTFPAAGTYNVVIAYACQNKQFYCNGTTGPVGGSVNGVTLEKSWYTTANLSAEDCSGNATVVVELDGAATCGAQ